MKYFILVYDQHQRKIRDLEVFPEGSSREALERRFELEHESLREPSLEVVMLSAESEADLERTHARYFKTVERLASAG